MIRITKYLVVVLLFVVLVGCKKTDQAPLIPRITNDRVESVINAASFKWTVDWPGRLSSVVEVSENEDMSNSQFYGSETETENHDFIAYAAGLKKNTRYYYRYLVWNKNYENEKFVMEVNAFSTTVSTDGAFSVSTNNKVSFSPGNLQCIASVTPSYLKFADHQWDCFGESQNFVYYDYVNEYQDTLDHDFFIWSKEYYYNITNGNGSPWRTLSIEDWEYLFNKRSTTSGIRFAKGKVGETNGVILLPDNWIPAAFQLKDINGGSFASNTVDLDTWKNAFEDNGAFFLPAAGNSTAWPPVNRYVKDVGVIGVYGSHSYDDDDYYFIKFSNTQSPFIEDCDNYQSEWPYAQQWSIRLVRDL